MKFLKYIPISIIFIILMIVWSQIFATPIQPYWGHYLSIILFVLSFFLYFVNTKLGLYTTGIMLLLGVFNIAHIFLGKYNISFFTTGTDNADYRSIKFDVRCIGLFILYLLCAWKDLFKYSKKA